MNKKPIGLTTEEELLWEILQATKQLGLGGTGLTTVELFMPSDVYTVTPTYSGQDLDINVTYNTQTQNTFLAAPVSGTGVPTFRALDILDIPSLSTLYVDLTTAQSVGGVKTFTAASTRIQTLAINDSLTYKTALNVPSVGVLGLGTVGTEFTSFQFGDIVARNGVRVNTAASLGTPSIEALGVDAAVSLIITTKATSGSSISLQTGGTTRLTIGSTVCTVSNQLSVTGNATFNGATIVSGGFRVTSKVETVPTNGGTTNVNNSIGTVYINPASVIASHTYQLADDSVLSDGTTTSFTCSVNGVTALTISPGVGSTISGALTTISAGQGATYRYQKSTTTWHKFNVMEEQLDIRYFTSQGIIPYDEDFTRFIPEASLEIPFEYDVKIMNYVFAPDEKRLVGRILVKRYLNGAIDSEYLKEEEINDKTMVDYFGNVIEPIKDQDGNFILDENGSKTYPPEAVMTEWTRLAILFNAPIPDGIVLNAYKVQLFENGKLYKP